MEGEVERLEREIREYAAKAARVDAEEADRLAGSESRPDSDEGGHDGEDELPSHRVATTPTGKPRPEARRNFTSRRKVIAEPVFGQAKEARRFRRFSLRGLRKVRREWTFVCLCSNLLKLVNVPLSLQAEPA